MAVVKYGFGVTSVKGSVGGATFQKCGQVSSLRIKKYHKVPSVVSFNTSQGAARLIASTWRGSDQSIRNAWTAAAPSFPFFDKNGDPLVLTGYQLFFALNKRLLMAGSPIVSAAPTYSPPAVLAFDFGVFYTVSLNCDLSFTGAMAADTFLVLFISQAAVWSSALPNAKVSFMVSLDSSITSPHELYTPIEASQLFAPVPGQQMKVSGYIIDALTGNYSSIASGFITVENS